MAEAESGKRIALLVDGENIAHHLASSMTEQAMSWGQLTLRRVYGKPVALEQWKQVPCFKLIPSGNRRNAADILLMIDAMDIVLRGSADAVVIASSDEDFVPLLLHLKKIGVSAFGIGEKKAPKCLRQASAVFVEFPRPVVSKSSPAPVNLNGRVPESDELLEFVRKLVAGAEPKGYPIRSIHRPVFQKFGTSIKQAGHANWRSYFSNNIEDFVCDPKDKDARVRLKKPS